MGIGNHWISPVSFYFVVQILSLFLSSATDSHFFRRLRPGEVGRQVGEERAVGRRIHGDRPLVAAALFAGNASAAAAAAHLQLE